MVHVLIRFVCECLGWSRCSTDMNSNGPISRRIPFLQVGNELHEPQTASGKNPNYSSPSAAISLALFSSRPPSSRIRPEYGYSRGTVGLSGASVYLHRSPKAMNPEAAKENWKRAFRGGTCGMSGPHIERTSSYSWTGSPKFRLSCWSHHPRAGRLWLDTHGSSG